MREIKYFLCSFQSKTNFITLIQLKVANYLKAYYENNNFRTQFDKAYNLTFND